MASGPPVVLSIAGFDPSSGAGVTADIKTLAAHGCFGIGCITALTVQSTASVRKVEPVAPRLVTETLRELSSDFTIGAVRIGMLGSAELVEVVAIFLKSAKIPHIVLDPIIRSSSGAPLLDAKGVQTMIKTLLPLSTVATPNVDEAGAMTGIKVTGKAEMKAAANKLHELGAKNVVVTGGHLEKAIDLLSMSNGKGTPTQEEFGSERIKTTSTHGTGCAFATALAANLAQGKQLYDAVVLAKTYVRTAIARAHALGKGNGPVNHLYKLEEQPRATVADVLLPVHGGGGAH
jgi:hydroxymethylpyrimidine/phosphomethylpyrimidine kinase